MTSWQQRERAQATLAKEIGYVRKPHGDRLRVALAFPNTYWVGMSNLGFQTVYKLFNAHDLQPEPRTANREPRTANRSTRPQPSIAHAAAIETATRMHRP